MGYPNDPLFPRQWGLQQIKAPAAWARGARGQGTVIAVVDSGVDFAHPDLEERLLPGIDLGQGRLGQPADCPPGPQDTDGHGTRNAGIMAAETDNGEGIAGVAPDARILPIRYGTNDQVPEGIRWAADQGADVIRVPAEAGFRTLDPANRAKLNAAADYAWSKGAVIVTGAGNSSYPGCEHPATRVICVAATERSGLPAPYSNLPVHTGLGVALRAPGGATEELKAPAGCTSDEFIWSTQLPGYRRVCPGPDGYGQLGATSWAAPHVAGVAAILAGTGLTNEEIVECLKRTSSKKGLYDPIMGYGIVDADAATRDCPGPRSRR